MLQFLATHSKHEIVFVLFRCHNSQELGTQSGEENLQRIWKTNLDQKAEARTRYVDLRVIKMIVCDK